LLQNVPDATRWRTDSEQGSQCWCDIADANRLRIDFVLHPSAPENQRYMRIVVVRSAV
jgi:hypothetical protein